MASLGTQRCDFEPQLFKLFAYDEAKTLGLSCLVFKIEIIMESVSHGCFRIREGNFIKFICEALKTMPANRD